MTDKKPSDVAPKAEMKPWQLALLALYLIGGLVTFGLCMIYYPAGDYTFFERAAAATVMASLWPAIVVIGLGIFIKEWSG